MRESRASGEWQRTSRSSGEWIPEPEIVPRRVIVARWIRFVLGGVVVLWAALQFVLFLRMNPALWSGPPGRRLGVFSGLFSADWSFSLEHTPPLMFLAACVMAWLTAYLGVLIVRAFDVALRGPGLWALGFAVGMGASGIVFELLTMAGLLYPPLVWFLWGVMFAAAMTTLYVKRGHAPWRKWRADEESLQPFGLEEDTEPEKYVMRSKPEIADESIPERVFRFATFGLIVLITLATFWHALFFPEAYWDSLILYLGYGRMTFLENAFPFKAVGQVGIGLGANYPHLFSNYGAVGSTMFGTWSDLHQRLAAPLAGTLAVVLVYCTVLLVGGRRSTAMAAALLFRSVPLGIAYSTYASDYAIAILFTAAFFYAAAVVARSRLPGAVVLMTFIPAAAMHINYLMGILWLPWMVALWFAYGGLPWGRRHWEEPPEMAVGGLPISDPMHVGRFDPVGRGVLSFATSRAFWGMLAVCVALSSTWHVRNWVLTGNPVYAFFPEIFRGSININPEVMESADLEWFRNGDGVGRFAEQFVDIEAGRPTRDVEADDFEREATFGHRFRASHLYWQGFETFRVDPEEQRVERGFLADRLSVLLRVHERLPREADEDPVGLSGETFRMLTNPHAYKMAPLVVGFALPGALLALLILMLQGRGVPAVPLVDRRVAAATIFPALALALGLLGYHYLLADYYLYQILPILVPLGLLAGVGLLAWQPGTEWRASAMAYAMMALVLLVGLVPGLAMSLMNFKVAGGGIAFGQQYSALQLDIFRHPGMRADIFYRLAYGEDAEMWEAVNEMLRDEPLLTHDNRHYMYDPGIELVHLDDWDVQQTWELEDPDARLAFYRERGVRYYLRIPMEFKHPVNARAGLQELIDRGDLSLVRRFGQNELYRFRFPGEPEEERREGTIRLRD